ncbi:MAG TPA: FG-GAP repeat protein, partial [Urbifossiella sp.]|nr:FG-GAP repeat protein [Urbifossiella sp.]
DFFGLDDPNFRGGVRVAVGDLTGDGKPDLVVGAGTGGGSRVAVYDATALLADSSHPVRVVNDFFAFDSGLRNGVNLAVGDVNGDGYDDLIFGAGAGGSPRVSVWDGQTFIASGGATRDALLVHVRLRRVQPGRGPGRRRRPERRRGRRRPGGARPGDERGRADVLPERADRIARHRQPHRHLAGRRLPGGGKPTSP